MPDIDTKYEILQRKNLVKVTNGIKQTYQSAIREIEVSLQTIKYNGRRFNLNDYPALKKKIDAVIKSMHTNMYVGIVNGIDKSWDISNQKNDAIIDKRITGRLKKKARQALYDPNHDALSAFITRKEKGMNLSDRIWKNIDPFKKELEQTIGLGIGSGRPATDIANDIKKNLIEPDRLYRRVRGEDGKLHLSAAARDYHPGQGIYRSSYKNAFRVARTETNIAYRTSDHLRWQGMPFVVGIQIVTSNNHPQHDICDTLAGSYPKDFKFVGWHPQCLCHQVAKQVSDAEFEKMEDQVLAGEPITGAVKGTVNTPPAALNKYLNENKDRIRRWKNVPYFIKDNPAYTSVLNNS